MSALGRTINAVRHNCRWCATNYFDTFAMHWECEEHSGVCRGDYFAAMQYLGKTQCDPIDRPSPLFGYPAGDGIVSVDQLHETDLPSEGFSDGVCVYSSADAWFRVLAPRRSNNWIVRDEDFEVVKP